MVVIEFVCRAKPGHYAEVSERYSAFAADFLSTHEALKSVLVFSNEAAGEVRGLGVYADKASADAVSSDPQFAEFNDAVSSLLAGPPDRHEYELLHLYAGNL